MNNLGAAAVPNLLELAEDADPEVAEKARNYLDRENWYTMDDFRDWNFTRAKADQLLTEYHARQEEALRAEVMELLGLDISAGTVLRNRGGLLSWKNGKRMLNYDFEPEDEEALVEQLKAAGWEATPVSNRMLAVTNRDPSLFEEFRDIYLIDGKREGYWFFRDLHPDATDPTDPGDLLTRDSYHFVLAYYNSRNGNLYIFQVDQSAQPDK